MDLDDTSEYYANDDRVVVIENIDDLGQPYTCEQWAYGNAGPNELQNAQIFTDDGPLYPIFDMLSIENYYAERAVIDHEKVFRYLGVDNAGVIALVDNILNQWTIGDINGDQIINILDIIIIINNILNGDYSYVSDINQDEITNIQDIVILIWIILED